MDFLSSLKIRTRLLGAFAISVLITVLVGLQGMSGASDLAHKLDNMYANQLVPIKDIANANMAAIYMNRALYAYVIEDKQAEMDKIKATMIDAQYKKYNELMDKYLATELTEPEKALVAKVKAAWPAYLTAADKVMKFSYQQQNVEGMDAMTKEAIPAFNVVDDLLSELVELNGKLAKEADEEGDAKWAAAGSVDTALSF